MAAGKRIVPERLQALTDAFLGYLANFKLEAMGMGGVERQPCPDTFLWNLYSQMDRTGKLPEDGGLLDQPYMLMAELGAVSDAMEIQRPKNKT